MSSHVLSLKALAGGSKIEKSPALRVCRLPGLHGASQKLAVEICLILVSSPTPPFHSCRTGSGLPLPTASREPQSRPDPKVRFLADPIVRSKIPQFGRNENRQDGHDRGAS